MDLDLDADEQNDVLQTLLEQELSTPELVRQVLSQVQTEFAAWNIAHCRRALTSFTSPSNWESRPHPDLRSPDLASMAATFNDDNSPLGSPETDAVPPELVFQQVYSPEGTVIETSSVKIEVVCLSSPLESHPEYESCSPLHRSVFKGDDNDNMGFIPYADDHTFNQNGHAHHYGSFSWQDHFDPDLEIIVLETVHRLQVQYALTYDEIEDCNALPLKLYSKPGTPGVLPTARRRDRLTWAGETIPPSYTLPLPTQPEESDFRNRLGILNSFFCPNLSCIEPLCSVHVESNPMPARSESPSPRVGDEVTSSCRNQCFVDKMEQPVPSWSEADIDVFRVISEISPNTTPCDLAELCLKPCYEVFYYRNLLHSGNPDNHPPADIRNQRRAPRFNDNDPAQFTPNNPCCHAGPCSSASQCPCFKNQSHCQRNCGCSPECNRRWRGCRCSKFKSKGNCATERCPCVMALRECDPELCTNCRCIVDGTPCRNSQIQRGTCKALEVKKSDWGLGVFLAEEAKVGDLIIEYVGELIYEPTVESRADLAAHRRRCYVFGLNNTFSLDATYAGNISRFINHSDTKGNGQVNSQARVRLVNGDHRIGIFAVQDMEAGSEILMNYGSEFFIK